MSNSQWFETIAVAERRARRRLPSSVFGALRAGTERGHSSGDNVAAFDELEFAPHVADLPASRDLATSAMGLPMAMPVLISPTGIQAVHPDGEVAVAKAAASRGVLMCLSSFASKPIEEVVSANPSTIFQLYWAGSRADVTKRVERARAAGCLGLIITLDWSFSHGRDWGSPSIPTHVDWRTALRHVPAVLTHPRWFAPFVRARQLPTLTVPNMTAIGERARTFFEAYGQWMQTPPPTWADVEWLVQEWGGPVMLKGITRVDDARRAVDVGCHAISVSNHGGNNLDGTPAPIRSLAAVVDAVGADVEVLLDGGIRRGSDVVKALAFGARGVMIGRASLWGLAVNGRTGVENVLDILRDGIDSTLFALGRASVHDVKPEDVYVPEGFARALGRSSLEAAAD